MIYLYVVLLCIRFGVGCWVFPWPPPASTCQRIGPWPNTYTFNIVWSVYYFLSCWPPLSLENLLDATKIWMYHNVCIRFFQRVLMSQSRELRCMLTAPGISKCFAANITAASCFWTVRIWYFTVGCLPHMFRELRANSLKRTHVMVIYQICVTSMWPCIENTVGFQNCRLFPKQGDMKWRQKNR